MTNYVQGPPAPEVKRLPVSIQSVKIKDFKNIEDLSLNLSKLNDIYGKNKTGKTSVLEAIQFCLQGKKSDVSKIRKGAEKAKVEVDIMEGEVHLSISTTINKSGTVTCKVKANGITHNQPRSLIKRLISFGTFDPRVMLEKEDRLSRLLQLIPIHIKKEDLAIPEMNIKELPIKDPVAINFGSHAWNVLESVEKDLRDSRLALGREHKLLSSAYQKRKSDLTNACVVFQKNYNKDPFNVKNTLEEEVRNQEKLNNEFVNLSKELNEKKESIKKDEYDMGEHLRGKRESIENIHKVEKRIKDLQKEKQEHESKLKEQSNTLERLAESVKEKNKSVKDMTEKYEEKKDVVGKSTHNINMARESQKLIELSQDLKKDEKGVNEKELRWKLFDKLCKEAMPLLKNKLLAPISKSVKGLSVDGDSITYNGVSIDELSGSEIVELSVKLMSLENKSRLLFINEAECLDSESIKGIDFKDFSSVIIARVGDKPLGGEWNSVEKKK